MVNFNILERPMIRFQYFIWSTDNIGKLATETLLNAADRGVHVRVLVDDFLIDADTDDLFALAYHPNIEIRIYNPTRSVGTTLPGRIFNTVTDLRGVNQRMHNKTFIVDNKVVITGGRNMANEYFHQVIRGLHNRILILHHYLTFLLFY